MKRCSHCGGTLIREYGELSCLACGRSPETVGVQPTGVFGCGHDATQENTVPAGDGHYAAGRCRTCMSAAGKAGQIRRYAGLANPPAEG